MLLSFRIRIARSVVVSKANKTCGCVVYSAYSLNIDMAFSQVDETESRRCESEAPVNLCEDY